MLLGHLELLVGFRLPPEGFEAHEAVLGWMMSGMVFERTFIAGWGDMDFNSHMRNTAFLDKSSDMRLMFLASCGFPIAEFQRLRFGAFAIKDELEYRREFQLHDEVRATMMLAGLADDGSRVIWRNDFYREDTLAVHVTTLSGWLDLDARKLVPPPSDLLDAIRDLPHSDDYAVLPDRVR